MIQVLNNRAKWKNAEIEELKTKNIEFVNEIKDMKNYSMKKMIVRTNAEKDVKALKKECGEIRKKDC